MGVTIPMQEDNLIRLVIDLQLDDQTHEDAELVEVTARAVRRDCGRWLAMRRAARGMSDEMIEQRTGLTPLQLYLLEQGQLDPVRDTVPEGVWRALAAALEGEQLDFMRVSSVIRLAIGRAEVADTQKVPQVAADLGVIENELQLLPYVSQVLVALTNRKSTVLEIQDEIAARTHQEPIPLGTLATVLDYLDQYYIMRRAATPVTDGQPSFHLTQEGMRAAVEAVRFEERRVALTEQRERAEQQQQLFQEAQQRLKNTLALQPPLP